MTEDWKSALQHQLEDLVDREVVAGRRQEEVLAAITDAVQSLSRAHDEDPDPAEDATVEEPANDWPAAG